MPGLAGLRGLGWGWPALIPAFRVQDLESFHPSDFWATPHLELQGPSGQHPAFIPIEGWRPCRRNQSYFLPWNACPHPNIERYSSLELLSLSASISILSISSSYLANPPHSRSVREYSASSFLKRSLIAHLTNT